MILLVGLILGLIAGCIRAWVTRRPYTLPAIQRVELTLLSFLPQALVFFIPQTTRFFSQQWAAFILPISLGFLVLFAWFNRHLQGFWLLGLGLLLNLAVITANGGLMPISPETLIIVHGAAAQGERATEIINSRASGTKSVLLPVEETRLEWLADRITLPEAWPIQIAFSVGDLFLAAGAFWVLWTGGALRQHSASAAVGRESFSSQS